LLLLYLRCAFVPTFVQLPGRDFDDQRSVKALPEYLSGASSTRPSGSARCLVFFSSIGRATDVPRGNIEADRFWAFCHANQPIGAI
jgi:hypothetical protein